MPDEMTPSGLGDKARSDWPSFSGGGRAIDRMIPNSTHHLMVRDYLLKRLRFSERRMCNFYPRWEVAERKVQAYVDLPKWEQVLKDMNDSGAPPKSVPIVIPYAYATISTIVTYHLQVFTGRRPMFTVGSYKQETVEGASMMETILQYNADHTRAMREFFRFIQDGQIYGFGALLSLWEDEFAMRTVRRRVPQLDPFGIDSEAEVEEKELRRVYSGNTVTSLDPFFFFPDPRVPMTELAARGEFVFWRNFEGKHLLKKMQANGDLNWVDAATNKVPVNEDSRRGSKNMLSGLREDSWNPRRVGLGDAEDFYQVDQGTVEIIPAELGLGESENPEKWMFTILNKDQIVQADPLNLDHSEHPVAIIEPYELGHGFGNLGGSDFVGPLQDTITWLVNSHQDNVRKTLNDMLVVDPSAVEMQDLRDPKPGKLIRLKKAAYGRDIRTLVSQLAVTDVTAQHMQDAEQFARFGQALTAVTDNVLGLQEQGGRKTATEVRVAQTAAVSRLASQARLMSSQGFTALTRMMSLNVQQLLDQEFFLQVVGQEGLQKPIRVTPDQMTGDFYYPVHDGSLPIDKVALLDVWKEIFLGVLNVPQLQQAYSIPKMFEFIAELGGVKNIESMRAQPEEALQQQVAAGNAATPQEIQGTRGAPGPSPLIQAGDSNPGRRVAEFLG